MAWVIRYMVAPSGRSEKKWKWRGKIWQGIGENSWFSFSFVLWNTYKISKWRCQVNNWVYKFGARRQGWRCMFWVQHSEATVWLLFKATRHSPMSQYSDSSLCQQISLLTRALTCLVFPFLYIHFVVRFHWPLMPFPLPYPNILCQHYSNVRLTSACFGFTQ